MLERLNDIVTSVQNTANSQVILRFLQSIQQNFQEFSISPAVNRLNCDLLSCVNELALPDSRHSTTSLNIPVNEQLADILTLHLTNRQYKNALITLHQLRFDFCCGNCGSKFSVAVYLRAFIAVISERSVR
jgi:hypothetical protein